MQQLHVRLSLNLKFYLQSDSRISMCCIDLQYPRRGTDFIICFLGLVSFDFSFQIVFRAITVTGAMTNPSKSQKVVPRKSLMTQNDLYATEYLVLRFVVKLMMPPAPNSDTILFGAFMTLLSPFQLFRCVLEFIFFLQFCFWNFLQFFLQFFSYCRKNCRKKL